jgi:hypothetical protein
VGKQHSAVAYSSRRRPHIMLSTTLMVC